MIKCDEIINASGSVSRNVTSTVSKKIFLTKKRYKMDCYILHIALLVIIEIFIKAIIFYHSSKHRSKLKKGIAVLTI